MSLEDKQKTMIRLKRTHVNGHKLKILQEQNWECAICGLNMSMDTSNACLDHDHTTGGTRGVLCRNCNRGEGKVRTVSTMCKRGGSRLDWLLSLVQYLMLHKAKESEFLHPTHKTVEDKRVRTNKLARQRRAKKNGK